MVFIQKVRPVWFKIRVLCFSMNAETNRARSAKFI